MAKILPDPTFVRDGRTLADWLPRLVVDDRAARAEAGEAIGGMWKGTPRYSTDWNDLAEWPDVAACNAAFGPAVRAAVGSAGFDAAGFVRRLLAFRMSLHHGWLAAVERMSHHDPTYDARETELIERSILADDPADRERAAVRLARLFCAASERDARVSAESESSQAAGFVSYLVFGVLDTALLAADAELRMMLADDGLRTRAYEALARIGRAATTDDEASAARSFAPVLLDHLDAGEMNWHVAAEALAAIAGDDPATVDTLLGRLDSTGDRRAYDAATAIEHMAPRLAGRGPAVVARMGEPIGGSADGEPPGLAIRALASAGRDDEAVVRRIADLARARPPRMRTNPAFPQYPYDAVMYERGAAIDGLRYCTRFPAIAVPALVAAFDDFEEYDPDESYCGDHERVCSALSAFGPDAAPAASRLIEYLTAYLDGPGETYPKDALALLAAIGPAASAARPVLERMRGEEEDEFVPDELLRALDAIVRGARATSGRTGSS